MRRIAICVCTLSRPAGLRALLAAIDQQRLTKLDHAQIQVIVVDNSSARTATGIVQTHAAQARFRTSLVHEPRKGLTYARNAALLVAREANAYYLAFIDDDEVPDPLWLESLVNGLEGSGAAAAIGPVRPIFETPPGRWLPLPAYEERRSAQHGFVDDGYTCNVVLHLPTIDSCHLQFDARFNETGGEDTYFFKQAREKGLRIAWVENAIVYAMIPRHRMSAGWLWRRWYRTGTIEAHLGYHDPASASGRAFNLLRGGARLLAGSALVIGATVLNFPRRPAAIVASMFTLCRGAGLVANAFGREYREYARPDYR